MYYDENSLEESYTVVDHKGSVVHTAYSEGEAKKKAMELSNKSGKPHKVAFSRTATVKEDLDEMDFGSIGKTLSKYGKGVGDATPKTPSRSKVNTNYTMTGHREGQRSTGRVYTKVQDDDSDAKVAARATEKPDQVEAPKRGRGRPAGAFNKQDVKKGWSDEAKASMKAKLAARKAAKLAAANESELDEDDWSSIVEGMSLNSIVEFMLDEDFAALDETSKESFGSYMRGEGSGDAVDEAVGGLSQELAGKSAMAVAKALEADLKSAGIKLLKAAPIPGNKKAIWSVQSSKFADKMVVITFGATARGGRGVDKPKNLSLGFDIYNEDGSEFEPNKMNPLKMVSAISVDGLGKIYKERVNSTNESTELDESIKTTKQRLITDSIAYYASKLTANLIKE